MSALNQIVDLNISGNAYDNLQDIIEALQTMPKLEILSINLHKEDEVDKLLR